MYRRLWAIADNVTLNPGTGGAVLATDDIGSVHHQRVKISQGADGSATDVSATDPLAVDLREVVGTAIPAHDAADAGPPIKVGAKAIAHGSNPTAVAAADRTDLYANRHGIPFVQPGHPNTVTRTVGTTAAQTNTVAVSVGAGAIAVITGIFASVDAAVSATGISVTVGFGTTLNTPSAAGVADIAAYHPGIPAGGGFTWGGSSGILGIGGDGEDIIYSCEVPTGGSVAIQITYYTIES